MDDFETLEEYITIAKKTIAKFAPRIYPSLAKEMLSSEDAIASVATAIMTADWKWNPEYRSKTNTVRSKYSYRNQRAIWAIQTYVVEKNNYPKHLSLDWASDEDASLVDCIEDKKAISPIQKLENTDVENHVQELLHSGVISDLQREYISAYYLEDKTLQEVGNRYNITRESVRQTISTGMKALREYCNEY